PEQELSNTRSERQMGGSFISENGWLAKGALVLFLLLGLSLRAGAAEEPVLRTTLAVERITCGACLRVIDAELRKVPGILGMTPDLPTRRVTVDHDQEVTPDEVAAAITVAGYPARVEASLPLARTEAKLFRRGSGFNSGPGCCNPGGTNPVADSWRELRRRFRGERGCEPHPAPRS
ncbi:MAG TPA: heavy metal-associated domain-containing protein, partial [Desulfurivibrionaceae bacterium]|nr:heavy metal-associated domain-containing protein [Desulfurivibrionaceae bacterium]